MMTKHTVMLQTPRKYISEVAFDDRSIRSVRSGRDDDVMNWNDLVRVVVEPVEPASGEEELFVVLEGRWTDWVVPFGAPDATSLLERLLSLPGFNRAEFGKALKCCSTKRFVCWERHLLPI
jgi:hypothetical protein